MVEDIDDLVRLTEPGVPFDLSEMKMSAVEAFFFAEGTGGVGSRTKWGTIYGVEELWRHLAVSMESFEGGVEARSGAQSME